MTEKHRKKLSEARRRGLEEGRIKIWNKGVPTEAATKLKISQSLKGRKHARFISYLPIDTLKYQN